MSCFRLVEPVGRHRSFRDDCFVRDRRTTFRAQIRRVPGDRSCRSPGRVLAVFRDRRETSSQLGRENRNTARTRRRDGGPGEARQSRSAREALSAFRCRKPSVANRFRQRIRPRQRSRQEQPARFRLRRFSDAGSMGQPGDQPQGRVSVRRRQRADASQGVFARQPQLRVAAESRRRSGVAVVSVPRRAQSSREIGRLSSLDVNCRFRVGQRLASRRVDVHLRHRRKSPRLHRRRTRHRQMGHGRQNESRAGR